MILCDTGKKGSAVFFSSASCLTRTHRADLL
jgi:hypothetical protein